MKTQITLIVSVIFWATNGLANVTESPRPEARPQTMTTSELESSTRPQPRPDNLVTGTESTAESENKLHSFNDDWMEFDNPYLREDIPEIGLKDGARAPATESGLLRADDPELNPGQWEQKAYQVSGVTFLGPVSAQEASRLTGAPVREVYVDAYPTNNNRTYNTYGLLNHVRHLNDAKFANNWMGGNSSLGRADVAGAESLVQTANVGLTLAQGTLADAHNNMRGMGAVQAAAIAEAEAAVAAAEEALRLALEALEQAKQEQAEDEAAEDSDSDSH